MIQQTRFGFAKVIFLIVIVAVLVVVLLPVTKKAREAARKNKERQRGLSENPVYVGDQSYGEEVDAKMLTEWRKEWGSEKAFELRSLVTQGKADEKSPLGYTLRYPVSFGKITALDAKTGELHTSVYSRIPSEYRAEIPEEVGFIIRVYYSYKQRSYDDGTDVAVKKAYFETIDVEAKAVLDETEINLTSSPPRSKRAEWSNLVSDKIHITAPISNPYQHVEPWIQSQTRNTLLDFAKSTDENLDTDIFEPAWEEKILSGDSRETDLGNVGAEFKLFPEHGVVVACENNSNNNEGGQRGWPDNIEGGQNISVVRITDGEVIETLSTPKIKLDRFEYYQHPQGFVTIPWIEAAESGPFFVVSELDQVTVFHIDSLKRVRSLRAPAISRRLGTYSQAKKRDELTAPLPLPVVPISLSPSGRIGAFLTSLPNEQLNEEREKPFGSFGRSPMDYTREFPIIRFDLPSGRILGISEIKKLFSRGTGTDYYGFQPMKFNSNYTGLQLIPSTTSQKRVRGQRLIFNAKGQPNKIQISKLSSVIVASKMRKLRIDCKSGTLEDITGDEILDLGKISTEGGSIVMAEISPSGKTLFTADESQHLRVTIIDWPKKSN